MVLQYFSSLRKAKDKSGTTEADAGDVKSTVMSAEDERFLEKIASESAAPTGTASKPTIILDNGRKIKSKDAQIALMDGADQIPLPVSPPEGQVEGETAVAGDKKEKKNYWSYMPSIPRTSADWREVDLAPYIPSLPTRRRLPLDKEKGAADLASAAEAIKAGQRAPAEGEEEDEQEQERKDLSSILDRLHIGSSSAFSLSRESQKLMDEFTQILKDLVNGVPTAYDDLERLLTRRERDIGRMFANMPPWLQTLVKSLPAKMGTSLAPELMAGASEKPGADAQMRMKLDPDAKVGEESPLAAKAAANIKTQAKKQAQKRGVPTLKSLVSKQGAVASMLKSILNFLKLRFPAFVTGTNVLLSLAVFLLLFVFWYCHKRGREVRLESERLAASQGSLDEDSEGAEATDVEDSTVLEKESGDAAGTRSGETPSVLNQPEPKEIPLPGEKESAKKGTVCA